MNNNKKRNLSKINNFFMPSLIILLSICLTITYTYFILLPGKTDFYLSIFILIILIYVVIIIFKNFTSTNIIKYLVTILIIIILSSTYIILKYRNLSIYNNLSVKQTNITGKIKKVNQSRYSKSYIIEILNKDLISSNIIAYTGNNLNFNQGDIIKFKCKLKPITPISKYYINLLKKHITFSTFITNDKCKIIHKENLSFSYKFKIYLMNKIDRLFNNESSQFLKALYFGNNQFINKINLLFIKKSNLLHAFALSGMHVGFIIFFPIFFLKLFRVNKKFILIATSLILIFYLKITNMPISLIRACIMFWLYSFQFVFDLNKNILNTLFLSAAIILLIFPYELYSLGFQLSFSATLGIILFYKRVKLILPNIPFGISNSISLTLSAQVFVMPIIAIRLHEINLIGVFTNLMIVPIILLTIITSFISIVFSLFSDFLSDNFAQLTDLLFKHIILITKQISLLPFHFIVNNLNLLIIPYFYFLLPIIYNKLSKRISIFCICSSLIIAFLLLYTKPLNDNNIIVFKNNSNLIIFKNNLNIIICGEIDNEYLLEKINKFIISNQFKKISVIITNPNEVNIKFFSKLFKQIPATDCFLSDKFLFSNYTNYLFYILDSDRVKLTILNKDDIIEITQHIIFNKIIFKLICNHYSPKDLLSLSKSHSFDLEYL